MHLIPAVAPLAFSFKAQVLQGSCNDIRGIEKSRIGGVRIVWHFFTPSMMIFDRSKGSIKKIIFRTFPWKLVFNKCMRCWVPLKTLTGFFRRLMNSPRQWSVVEPAQTSVLLHLIHLPPGGRKIFLVKISMHGLLDVWWYYEYSNAYGQSFFIWFISLLDMAFSQ